MFDILVSTGMRVALLGALQVNVATSYAATLVSRGTIALARRVEERDIVERVRRLRAAGYDVASFVRP